MTSRRKTLPAVKNRPKIKKKKNVKDRKQQKQATEADTRPVRRGHGDGVPSLLRRHRDPRRQGAEPVRVGGVQGGKDDVGEAELVLDDVGMDKPLRLDLHVFDNKFHGYGQGNLVA